MWSNDNDDIDHQHNILLILINDFLFLHFYTCHTTCIHFAANHHHFYDYCTWWWWKSSNVTPNRSQRLSEAKEKYRFEYRSTQTHEHMNTHTHTGVNKMNEKINYINNRRSKNDEKNFTSFLNIIGEYITIKKKLKKTWRTNTQQTLTCWLKQEKQYQQVFQKKKMELMISTAKQQTNQSRLVWTIPDNHFLRIDLSIWTIWSRESWCVCVIYIPTISSWQPQRIVCKKNEH